MFSIHEIKKVKLVTNEDLVNAYIESGWVLLSSATSTYNGNNDVVATVGALDVDFPEPKMPLPIFVPKD